ncbi:MAG: hypothetical protein J0H12_04735 [Candidatus Paracaedimonas acanthamoebae]|uniref:Uncharacterized protein n=1 Tax=Candidatus Paracaedimonas acanthamoebae TaxID=244581 RepID=A0A8J7TUI7_9PROT|nr:hypothetical protein [Candidatus Paracaedimonas acanthamoebae]
MKFIFSLCLLSFGIPAFAGSPLDSLKEPFMHLKIYSATQEIEKLIETTKGDHIVLPTSLKITKADEEACKKKCSSSSGIFASGIDCQQGCKPQAIEQAILRAADKEWQRRKTIRVE